MGADEARATVKQAILRTNRTPRQFAGDLGMDPGTLYDFLNGVRPGSASTRHRIEQELGWKPGTIAGMFLGDPAPSAAEGTTRWTGTAPGVVGPDAEPVGLGLDADADGLTPAQIEAVRAVIRSMKAPPE